jgi:hypothetical protein
MTFTCSAASFGTTNVKPNANAWEWFQRDKFTPMDLENLHQHQQPIIQQDLVILVISGALVVLILQGQEGLTCPQLPPLQSIVEIIG